MTKGKSLVKRWRAVGLFTAFLASPALIRAEVSPFAVLIVAPSSGSQVAGRLTLEATVPIGVNLSGIQFRLDGMELGLKGIVSPYVMTWDSAQVPDGPHVLSAFATDSSGVSASAAVTIHVANLPPVIYDVGTAAVGPTNATVLWFTTNASDSQADFGESTLYGHASILDSALVSTHTVTLIGLTPGTTYHYRVKSRHAGGVQALSPDYTFTTPGSAAAVAPAVADASSVKAARRFLTSVNANAVFGVDAQEVTIYDLRGRQVFHSARDAGVAIVWNSRGFESGVYIAKIRSLFGNFYQSLAVVK